MRDLRNTHAPSLSLPLPKHVGKGEVELCSFFTHPQSAVPLAKWRGLLDFGSLFLFQNWVLEEKITWKNKETHLGKTCSDKYLEHPVFCTMLLYFTYYKPPQILYKINPFIWWRRGKCRSLTITESNVLCSVGLGLPQNTWLQMLNCFFRSLVKVPEHSIFEGISKPQLIITTHRNPNVQSSALVLKWIRQLQKICAKA